MKFADRMKPLSSGIFAELEDKRRALAAKGVAVINLSVGSPDMPPSPHIIRALQEACGRSGDYGYAVKDLPELRAAIRDWYSRRFGVHIDPETEITSLLGSQDGLAHIALTIVDPGDVVIVPDPGYPIFSVGPLIAGARLFKVPLHRDKGFILDFNDIPEDVARRAKLLIVSYPGNPVTVPAPARFYEDLIAFAKKYDIIVAHDNAYCELTFDGFTAGSFLAYPGAMDVGIELNSLSKTYNMAGCRIGAALGNRDVIQQLSTIKSHLDYGIFIPLQKAAIAALNGPQEPVRQNAFAYQRRRDALIDGLADIGWEIPKPKATMFVWAPVPAGFNGSIDFSLKLLEKTGVMVVPGTAFGKGGEGYVRIALVQPEEKINEAVHRIKESGIIK